MARKWNYRGDMNLENGGYFWRVSDFNNSVEAIEIIPESVCGGPDNVFMIVKGDIYMPADKMKEAFEVCGYDYEESSANMDMKVDAFMSHSGIQSDESETIQIGVDDPYRQRDSEWNPERISGNWKLANYVKKYYLK